MLYIYDVLLNWNIENKIYDFYDWELSDNIEHIKKIPLFLIESKTLKDFCNSIFNIDKQLLIKIKNLTECYHNKRIEKIPYGAIFTDGKSAVAIEFDSIGKSIHKSCLLLDEEEEVINISSKLNIIEINYKMEVTTKKNPYLTRNDELIKNFLKKEIIETYKKNDINKLKYIYIEYFGNITESNNIEEIYTNLINTLKVGINNKHNNIYSLLKLASSKK